MDNSLLNYVSRFIVPFYFDYGNEAYEKVFNSFRDDIAYDESLRLPKGRWICAGFWENYKSKKNSSDAKNAEMDIFSYLPDIFKADENAGPVDSTNLGASFVYDTDGKLFNACYYGRGNNENQQEISFECKDIGVLLFKNGIGFLWYEVSFNGDLQKKEYIEFLHDFKELARTQSKKFAVKMGYDQENKKSIYEPFCLGVWISKVLRANELGIHFWAARETTIDSNKLVIPDKALLFQYIFAQSFNEQERNDCIFQITNGYDTKYNAPEDLKNTLFCPFGNVCFYITNAGMGCVVTNDASNEAFFTGQFREKFVRDYFFIYLLLLYQSYSCAYYSRQLTLLPADESAFRYESGNIERIETLISSINLFLVKSIFDSVSNVDHQNGVFRYGKKRLCIDGDIKGITAGLEGFGAIERAKKNLDERMVREREEKEKEKQDGKVNRAITVFGFLVVISAILDGLNLVDWFRTNELDLLHILVVILILVFTLYLILEMLLQNIRKTGKKRAKDINCQKKGKRYER